MDKEQIEKQACSLLPAVLKSISGNPPIVAATALYMALQVVYFSENGYKEASNGNA